MAVKPTEDRIEDVWGARTPHAGAWPIRHDERLTDTPEHWVQSACALCSTGCGMDIGVKDGRIVGVRGRDVDEVNRGRLGPKGLHGWEANASADRLTTPLIRRGGRLEPESWDEAMALLVERSRSLKESHGPGAFGFYNTGQLFIEEYYTLCLLAEIGIGTHHVDGNTRMCTATAAVALVESFGTDGDPGCYQDFDLTDAIFMVGHNMASTQTVLWSRVLDRLEGPNPPKLVVVDPRTTPTAKRADVHLAPRLGTNVALLNGLLHLIIKNGWFDRGFIDAHAMGFEKLQGMVQRWPPDRTASVTSVPVSKLHAAAEILGTSPTLVSTVLQGVYQSNQATAAALQVNNLHIIRGMIGKPGATVFQMNGQPTAQNTRECGCNGEMVAFRNWQNLRHVEEQARIWNVEPGSVPHHTPPTHAMQIFRYAEMGSIRFLWIVCTNPAASLPELHRIRSILKKPELFVVVQDAFLTETAACADLVLPAAMWAEKTGCFTNADRTVHISHKAIEPPGDARPDFEIFLDYARKMDFRDKDGAPLIKWSTPEEAFDAWRECSRGRPCDYSGMSYDKLTGGPGVRWPCNEEYPEGRQRLFENGVFNTSSEYCESFGHDIETGALVTPQQYMSNEPGGRAVIKAADYVEPHESPDERYPFWLTTGRVVYHFHTRTKTARARALDEAAPEPYVEISQGDADELGVIDGDMLEISSRRGCIRVPARVAEIAPGHLFVPFHYGYWDHPHNKRAANELTITGWDPVSKQPHFKFAAVRVRKV